uniref:Uncharacterized protein n=1 Tax=Anguilla anguilla TaxID=7936 RepID=A0A0E9UR83_ANGAN
MGWIRLNIFPVAVLRLDSVVANQISVLAAGVPLITVVHH